VVTTAEELPVAESLDLVGRVRAETSVDLAAVVANRVPSQWFPPSDAAVLERLCAAGPTAAIAAAAGVPAAAAGTVLSAASLAARRRATAVSHLDHLRAGLVTAGVDRRLPLLLVPEFSAAPGHAATPAAVAASVAESLSMELS
jgi:hypothetical protein